MTTLGLVIARVATACADGALSHFQALMLLRAAVEDEGAEAADAERDRLEDLLFVAWLRAPHEWPAIVRAHLANEPLPAPPAARAN